MFLLVFLALCQFLHLVFLQDYFSVIHFFNSSDYMSEELTMSQCRGKKCEFRANRPPRKKNILRKKLTCFKLTVPVVDGVFLPAQCFVFLHRFMTLSPSEQTVSWESSRYTVPLIHQYNHMQKLTKAENLNVKIFFRVVKILLSYSSLIFLFFLFFSAGCWLHL